MTRRSDDAITWLRQNPSLEQLRAAYPHEWPVVQRDLGRLIARADPQELTEYVSAVARPQAALPGRARPRRELLSAEVRRQMTIHLLNQAIMAASTGVHEGRIRFNLVNGYLAQKLLFRRDLERKPVSLAWFRLLWPLLGQRRLLMPLVRKKGIYCFYSKPLITRLADLIGERTCLEIAAGDGTLSRFLATGEVAITATDDHSWSAAVTYPDSVIREDARTALRTRQPQVVLCSWPPAGNTFEQHVFTTISVELYVVISTRHQISAGNWTTYRRQTHFVQVEDPSLSRLVLPPQLDAAVYLFHRAEIRE